MKSRTPLMLLALISATISTCFISGCGMDRSLDDYRREKMGQELAKYQAIAGTYSGPLLSGRDGVVGNLVLDIRAETANIDSNDRLSSEQKAILRGELTFTFIEDAGRIATVTFNDGYYNEADGTFRAGVNIEQSNASKTRLELYGKIRSGTFDGRIEVSGYSQEGGTFHAIRDDRSQPETPNGAPPASSPRPALEQRLISRATFTSDGRTETVRARISARESSNEEDFLLIFRPIRTVNVVMNMEPGMIFISPDARWDIRSGTLRAKLTTPSGVGQLELFCKELVVTNGAKAWNCHADGLLNSLFDGIFTPEI